VSKEKSQKTQALKDSGQNRIKPILSLYLNLALMLILMAIPIRKL
jgi:hypothetical protein